MTGIYESLWRSGLVRPLDGRVLGGVCAGLARRFGIDAWPMRWLFLIVLVVLPGSPLLIYPLLWIFMPGEDWVARVHGPSAYAQAFPGARPQAYPAPGAQAYPAPGAQAYPGSAEQPPAAPTTPQDPADGPR
ncbi:PspC domain-containing protein [Cellulomonas sp. IC4_254]|uniref:PspC domain-containing protein n=1 Tax=Cellulomonas sp. IC4_254 TaxID=2714040 RepID=UPI001422D070|nr:PspC domain-containing protein [Cellulomonas sp. IC4_254]NHT17408.1 PspC domain-containing protein [Cellulomonas sp. IC4_254]